MGRLELDLDLLGRRPMGGRGRIDELYSI